MKSWLIIISIFIGGVVSMQSYSVAEPDEEMSNILIANGGVLKSFNYSSGDESQFFDATNGGRNLISLSLFSKVNSNVFSTQTGMFGVGLFDAVSKNIVMVDEKGTCPAYVPEVDSLVYFSTFENKSFTGKDNEYGFYHGLFSKDLSGDGTRKLIYRFDGASSTICPMVISDYEVVFYEGDNNENLIKLDFKTGKSEPYSVPNCKPIMSLGNSENFLCLVNNSYVIREKNGRVITLPADVANRDVMIPNAYIPEINALIISETGYSSIRGETRNLWIYDIERQEKRLLKKNMAMGYGAAIFNK